MTSTAVWTPVFVGDQRQRVLDRILAIGADLSALEERGALDADPTLGTGRTGVALFFAYLPRELRDEGTRQLASDLMQKAVRSAGPRSMDIGLFEGLSGPLWGLEHLFKTSIGDPDADPLRRFDEMFVGSLEERRVGAAIDLISGLVGLGTYFVERLPSDIARRCLMSVVERLGDTAQSVPTGLAWPTPTTQPLPRDPDRQPYDLGVAHGLAGIIAFLAVSHAAGVRRKSVRAMLEPAVRCLAAQERANGGSARFPYTVSFSDRLDGRPPRIAWCYGEAGIASALWLAGRSLDVRSWKQKGLELADRTARATPESAGVVDAGLCHGSAGLAHILNRIAQASRDEDLARGARSWYETTLDLWRPGEGIGGFPAWDGSERGQVEWVADPGFLGGAAGVGLSLSASLSSREPAWDTLLLASIPPRSAPSR